MAKTIVLSFNFDIILTSASSSTNSSSTTSALYSNSKSLIGLESKWPLIKGNAISASVVGLCCGS